MLFQGNLFCEWLLVISEWLNGEAEIHFLFDISCLHLMTCALTPCALGNLHPPIEQEYIDQKHLLPLCSFLLTFPFFSAILPREIKWEF
jgi:hypothetical protein